MNFLSQNPSEQIQQMQTEPNRSKTMCQSGQMFDRGRTLGKRHVSADTAQRARHWFSSPDRYVPTRPSPSATDRPIHSSQSPQKLSPRERYTRSRDNGRDPFRTPSSSRSRDAVPHRPLGTDRRPQPPHFTPDFVHANGSPPPQRDARGFIDIPRQISAGGVWNVGGRGAAQGGPLPGVSDGSGRVLSSGSNAPMYTARFLDQETPSEDLRRHQNRLAVALDIDPASRILSQSPSPPRTILSAASPTQNNNSPFYWRDGAWTRENELLVPKRRSKSINRTVPAVPVLPFRVLDAPRLRDDFYCSLLAYSHTARTLAVGLSSRVYLWSEDAGVQYPPLTSQRSANYVTSLSFSSIDGDKSILAVGRQGGQVTLWSCQDSETRFEAQQPNPVSCVSFKPNVTQRKSQYLVGQRADCEDLLVGDEVGNVFYYSVEWPRADLQRRHPDWTGTMTLLAKVSAHSQQICGLVWSPDGKFFATGGNDNCALLFEISRIIGQYSRKAPRLRRRQSFTIPPSPAGSPNVTIPQTSMSRDVPRGRSLERGSQSRRSASPPPPRRLNPNAPNFIARRIAPPITLMPTAVGPRPLVNLITPPPSPPGPPGTPAAPPQIPLSPRFTSTTIYHPSTSPSVLTHPPQTQTHTFPHTAAVKALAFAPWEPTLLATGGGSNDRQIHFWHTRSGALLAIINVHAQVTSLIWSRTRREVCATFGYAQPEHRVRIAVFAWPSGECMVAIPWETNVGGSTTGDGGRALWAIPYPGGPNERRRNGANANARGRDGDGDRAGGGGGGGLDGDGEGGTWWSRTAEEGCVIVASSDESVKFHEVWSGARKGGKKGQLGGMGGVLGGSRILEGVEGVDELESGFGEGDVIR